jgi:hypothetical protein
LRRALQPHFACLFLQVVRKVVVEDLGHSLDSIDNIDVIQVYFVAQFIEQLPLRIAARVGEQQVKFPQANFGEAVIAPERGDSGIKERVHDARCFPTSTGKRFEFIT